MKLSDLFKKFKDLDPETEVSAEDLKEDPKAEETVQEQKPEQDQEQALEAEDSEDPKPEQPAPEGNQEQKPEQAPEQEQAPEAEQETAPKEQESAVDLLLKKQEFLEQKLQELENKNQELQTQKQELDSRARLDRALAQGWLVPAMLEEGEGAPSVFVDLASQHPDLFDRLSLVMAPKALTKKAITEAPADQSAGKLSDSELYNRVNSLAKEQGISYSDAFKIFNKNN